MLGVFTEQAPSRPLQGPLHGMRKWLSGSVPFPGAIPPRSSPCLRSAERPAVRRLIGSAAALASMIPGPSRAGARRLPALIPQARKGVVPAPDEPVKAMMGCLTDMVHLAGFGRMSATYSTDRQYRIASKGIDPWGQLTRDGVPAGGPNGCSSPAVLPAGTGCASGRRGCPRPGRATVP